jgi:NOL1/NOP2/fmu family ribosome biogenesis protein
LLDTAKIGEMFSSYFDLVLCDAPCSGEGMFRKYDEALEEWSEENVRLCAERQSEILNNLAGVVRDGGYLLYSTCTYSKEENEDTVREFLNTHPEFTLCPVKDSLINATAPGLDDMTDARRFYPHITKGEGQFIALMKKSEITENMPTILYKESIKQPSKDEINAFNKFQKENIDGHLDGRIIKWGESLALISHDLPIPPYSVFMPGVLLGEVKKGNLFPHHQLFSAYGERFLRRENLKKDDERVVKYLRGEEIDSEISGGWCAVCYEGVSLGGGKASGGKIKNHYPKGLRNN